MPSRRRSMTYAAVLAAVLSVAACSGGDPAPTPSATSPVTTGTTTAPSTSPTGTPPATSTTTASPPPATPTSTGPAFPAGVPAAARQRTNEGAKAFVAHFVKQFNRSWATPDPSALEVLCLPRYEACGAYLNDAREFKMKSQRFDGDALTFTSLISSAPEGELSRVLLVGQQEQRNVISKTGAVVQSFPEEQLRIMYALQWTKLGWQIYSAKSVK